MNSTKTDAIDIIYPLHLVKIETIEIKRLCDKQLTAILTKISTTIRVIIYGINTLKTLTMEINVVVHLLYTWPVNTSMHSNIISAMT